MENESLDSNPHILPNARVSQAPFFIRLSELIQEK